MPLFQFLWGLGLTSIIIYQVPVFYIEPLFFFLFVILPIIIIILLSFIIVHFFYVSKRPMFLILNVRELKPSYLVKKLDKVNFISKNIYASYTFKNALKKTRHSILFISVAFFMSFLMLSFFSVIKLNENTISTAFETLNFNSLSLINVTSESYIREINQTELERKINSEIEEEQILTYDFGLSTVSNLNWYETTDSDSWCQIWNDEVVSYLEKIPINNAYVSKEGFQYLERIINSHDLNSIRCSSTNPYPDYFVALEGFVNYYKNEVNKPNIKGIALGYNVQSRSDQDTVYLQPNVAFSFKNINDQTNDFTGNEYYTNGSFTFTDNTFLENQLNLPSFENEKLEEYLDLTQKKDGKVYFFSSNDIVNSVLQNNFYRDDIVNITVKPVFSSQQKEQEVTLHYYDDIFIPFIPSSWVSMSDPDFDDVFEGADLLNTTEYIERNINLTTINNPNNDIPISINPNPSDYISTKIETANLVKNDLRNNDTTFAALADSGRNADNIFVNPYLLSDNETALTVLNLILTALESVGAGQNLESFIDSLIAVQGTTGPYLNIEKRFIDL